MVEKLSISLPDEIAEEVRACVESGRYASSSEVIRTAMRSWLREEEEHALRIEAIRSRLQQAIDDPRPRLSAEEILEHFARRAGEDVAAAAR
ncbi:type II toxin-antitoxin system ParD family antitoxin [Minwuia sp.]|uniref:type II toxin-antitoxin system ParD family antitoxin n=1 Tax=Minwuia sp. TaxID=2493630 RepID=UPI003A9175BD